MIVLVICHFLASAKFREILRQYQNSAEKGKFRDLARNSAARRELWALIIGIIMEGFSLVSVAFMVRYFV